MKTRRIIYVTIGSILVLINLLFDLMTWSEYNAAASTTQAYDIGYFLGSHILLIFGLVFLRLAYKLNKRIKKAPGDELEESINSIGKN